MILYEAYLFIYLLYIYSRLLELEEKLESVLKKVREERIKRIYED